MTLRPPSYCSIHLHTGTGVALLISLFPFPPGVNVNVRCAVGPYTTHRCAQPGPISPCQKINLSPSRIMQVMVRKISKSSKHVNLFSHLLHNEMKDVKFICSLVCLRP